MDDGKCPENQNKIGKYLDWPYKGHICTTPKLIALRIQQLSKHDDDIKQAAQMLYQSWFRSKLEFEWHFQKWLWHGEYYPGDLVLVRNTWIEKELDRKTKPRYLGPYEVVWWTKGGSYVLKELNGALSRCGVAAFRLLPYHSRNGKPIPPHQLPLDEPDESLDDDIDESSDWGQSNFKRGASDEHRCQAQHVSNSNSAIIKHLLLLPSSTASKQPTLPHSIHHPSSIIHHQWQLPILSLLNPPHLNFPNIQ